MATNNLDDITDLTFEEALTALQDTVTQLESETLSLTDLIALYQKGIALTNHCDQQLEQAELSIQQLNSANG